MDNHTNTSAIFIRKTKSGVKFLDWRYRWSNMPDVFPACQLRVVREVMLHPRNPAPPTGWARVATDGIIDLDNLEVMPL